MSDWKKGKIIISCPQCGLDRGKEVGGLGTACPKCGFKPELETKDPCECSGCHQDFSACICGEAPQK